jgi:hypothetical protein
VDNDASYYSHDEETGQIVKKKRVRKKIKKRSVAEIEQQLALDPLMQTDAFKSGEAEDELEDMV